MDLYEIIVGQGGVSPEYFFTCMAWWEVQRYINGTQRRSRANWEQARYIAWTVACLMGCKKDMQEFTEFPWEKEHIDPEQHERDLQALVEQVRRENAEAAKQEEELTSDAC